MPKAVAVAYVVYQVTDLDRMELFLKDFGLIPAGQLDGALYMRGTGPMPYIHVTQEGAANRFVGAALRMQSRDDLLVLAGMPGSSEVVEMSAPGNGLRVRMITPDGFQIDAVWGIKDALALPLREPNPFNAAVHKTRKIGRCDRSANPVRFFGSVISCCRSAAMTSRSSGFGSFWVGCFGPPQRSWRR